MTTVLVGKKLSELLRIAVADAQQVEREGHVLDMRVYLERLAPEIGKLHPSNKCRACMAGAVMICRMDGERVLNEAGGPLQPGLFDENADARGLHAIDLMRVSGFRGALGYIREEPPTPVERDVLREAQELVEAEYLDSGYLARASWETYLRAATVLERAGL